MPSLTQLRGDLKPLVVERTWSFRQSVADEFDALLCDLIEILRYSLAEAAEITGRPLAEVQRRYLSAKLQLASDANRPRLTKPDPRLDVAVDLVIENRLEAGADLSDVARLFGLKPSEVVHRYFRRWRAKQSPPADTPLRRALATFDTRHAAAFQLTTGLGWGIPEVASVIGLHRSHLGRTLSEMPARLRADEELTTWQSESA